MRHLQAVPDDGVPDGDEPQWLVRVWYAVDDQAMKELLAEGLVASLREAADYAGTTYRAQLPRRRGDVWVQAIPGRHSPAGLWQPAGTEQRATFDNDVLSVWIPVPSRSRR